MTADSSQALIDAILAFFGLGAAQSAARTALGMANHSTLVTTQGGRTYVVKQLVHQQVSLLPNDLAIQEQLHGCGMRAPRYLASPGGEYVYQQGSVRAVVSERIAGVHPAALTPPLARAMGGALARYHQAVRSLPLEHAGWLNRRGVGPAANGDLPVAAAALALLAAGSVLFAEPLPQGILHGDFHMGNLLLRSQTDPTIVALLDFEEAQPSPLLVDVGFGLFGSHALSCSRRRTEAHVYAFLDGYEAVRPLEAAERGNLAQAVCFVAGATALWLLERGYVDNAVHNVAVAHALQRIDFERYA